MALRDETAYRSHVGRAATAARTTIRRVTISLTVKALWHLVGADDDDKDVDVEVFSGVGFFSRPPDSANAEAIVVKVGGSTQHPVIIATRDEQTRQAFAAIAALAADESAIYNSQARVHVQADGTVVVDDGSGAVALALKSDVDGVVTALTAHTHTVPIIGPVGTTPTTPTIYTSGPPTVLGTAVLKGK